jgi:hypothetical protein
MPARRDAASVAMSDEIVAQICDEVHALVGVAQHRQRLPGACERSSREMPEPDDPKCLPGLLPYRW